MASKVDGEEIGNSRIYNAVKVPSPQAQVDKQMTVPQTPQESNCKRSCSHLSSVSRLLLIHAGTLFVKGTCRAQPKSTAL